MGKLKELMDELKQSENVEERDRKAFGEKLHYSVSCGCGVVVSQSVLTRVQLLNPSVIATHRIHVSYLFYLLI